MKTGSAAVMAATKKLSDAATSDSESKTSALTGLESAAKDASDAVDN